MAGFFPAQATVIIGAAGAASSAAANKTFTTYVTNFSESGGAKNIDTVQLFGGAQLTVEKPRDPIEVSFDVVMKESLTLLFDQMIHGSVLDGSTGVNSTQDSTNWVIYVSVTGDDGSTVISRGYNNCYAVSFEPSMSADEYLQGTITFNLSATTDTATANKQVIKGAATGISWA